MRFGPKAKELCLCSHPEENKALSVQHGCWVRSVASAGKGAAHSCPEHGAFPWKLTVTVDAQLFRRAVSRSIRCCIRCVNTFWACGAGQVSVRPSYIVQQHLAENNPIVLNNCPTTAEHHSTGGAVARSRNLKKFPLPGFCLWRGVSVPRQHGVRHSPLAIGQPFPSPRGGHPRRASRSLF